MEILLLCAWLVYTAGAQSEKAKVGLSPAQRDILRERTRHEKAVQKIAEKHGAAPTGGSKAGVSPWKEAPAAEPAVTIPEAFRSGYRRHTPIERVATPMGRRAGGWAAGGVGWVKDTGKGALREYRKRRKDRGHDDSAPVLVPLPPDHPPAVPPMPTSPPTAGTDSGKGISLEKPEATEPEGAEKPPGEATEPPVGGDGSPAAPEAPTGPETRPDGAVDGDPANPGTAEAATGPEEATEGPAPESAEAEPKDPAEPKGPEEPSGPAETDPAPTVAETEGTTAEPESPAAEPESPAAGPESPAAEPEGTVPEPINSEPAAAGEGVGRMAAEVTYESVRDESDELNLMCEADSTTYERIGRRCEREIGRGDSLLSELTARGAGSGLLAWITRCKENYGSINSELGGLKQNTKAQGEKVVQAKGLLEAGQGAYAEIAQDMESVMDRDFYTSDAVDSEDTSAHTEVYETKGA